MNAATRHEIQLGGQRVDFRVARSVAARKMRLRVGPNGVEVLQPAARTGEDVTAFSERNAAWLHEQLRRVQQLRGLHQSRRRNGREILFRGESTRVRLETGVTRSHGNAVTFIDDAIVVKRGVKSKT